MLHTCCSAGRAVPRAADAVVRLPEAESPVQPAGPGHQVPHRGEPAAEAERGEDRAGQCGEEWDLGHSCLILLLAWRVTLA